MKYIFVTGGVVSSLGKGLAAASIGTLLEHCGLEVTMQKFDPYLNIDPGTMSPYQHGEVYVLNDGAETDLDLGHYERFIHCELSRLNNLTSGKVFEQVLSKERKGVYLGKTVQYIPHVTDEIKQRLYDLTEKNKQCDLIITEIGGTVGDIEGYLFLEALRQFAFEVGRHNCCFIHVTLLPFIAAAGETKTKPTQQSVAKLREIGIQPDIIVCRTELNNLTEEEKCKIGMFCNVAPEHVVAFRDVKSSIYECPIDLGRDNIDRIVTKVLGITVPKPKMEPWEKFVDRVINPKHQVKIAVVGKYISLQDAYKSIYESFTHAGASNDCRVEIVRVAAEDLQEENGAEKHLSGVDAILVPGGFGDRGIEGKVEAVKYARENKIPFMGICLGMQVAVIEYARNVVGLSDANSTEFFAGTSAPVISLQEEQKNIANKGGTMRLGAYQAELKTGSLCAKLYNTDETISERHRHRYEFNPDYREQLEAAGLTISATNPETGLVEVVELRDHPFFIACQYHPEFQSRPNAPHPLFSGLVAAALVAKNTK